MSFNTSEILFIVMVAVVVTLLLICILQRVTIHSRINRAVDNEHRRNAGEIRDLNADLQRFMYLYNDLKATKAVEVPDTQRTLPADAVSLQDASDIIIAQKKLESEKEELSLRNQKLWEMSLSIQKEKQHIQLLKNDIEEKHKNITDSIAYAKRIQDAVVPRTEILRDALPDYFLFWRPKETVSGDFYWMKREGDILIFAIADCTGHGVPGAFMSMMGVAFLNEICAKIDDSVRPSDILEQLRSLVITTLKQKSEDILEPKDGMDIALCTLNLKTRVLRFSGANNPMYLVRDGELTEYRPIKNPIGLYPKLLPFETTEIQTQPGDYVYMFSDGYADQFGGEIGKKMSYKRFKGVLTDICKRTLVASEQEKMLADFLDEWRAEFMQMDDVLVGGYKM
ncbi:MAG: serine/threonine-protein phosphatase [Bacteroidales bacterium]|nr:serine/threonine-protein phosphatase [Bacteroidales bacterium]